MKVYNMPRMVKKWFTNKDGYQYYMWVYVR